MTELRELTDAELEAVGGAKRWGLLISKILVGAFAGAALGSEVPIIGTGFGAIIGGLVGGMEGSNKGNQ